ncbi:MAG: hypothetical protein EOO38_18845, partial [Cytophagaceae bacterium]
MRTSAQISSLADVVTCELCNKRMTLRALQKHLGHASAEMTRRYQRRRDRFRVNLTKAAALA